MPYHLRRFWMIVLSVTLVGTACSGQSSTFKVVVTTDEHGIEWSSIPGGSFTMGCPTSTPKCFLYTTPRHDVKIRLFQLMKTEVTVAMYRKCVEAGRCSPPTLGYYNAWGKQGREDHPINSVNWIQAKEFCDFVGGRLPSEAEWEYAARGSDGRIYPWGNQPPSCDLAVMDDGKTTDPATKRTDGCGRNSTWPICSKIRGNSPFGLCDMAGNVSEWTGDCWNRSYQGAPTDGSVWPSGDCSAHVIRGGDWRTSGGAAYGRSWEKINYPFGYIGLRCAKSLEP
jgi:formylglycine-generating enzyme